MSVTRHTCKITWSGQTDSGVRATLRVWRPTFQVKQILEYVFHGWKCMAEHLRLFCWDHKPSLEVGEGGINCEHREDQCKTMRFSDDFRKPMKMRNEYCHDSGVSTEFWKAKKKGWSSSDSGFTKTQLYASRVTAILIKQFWPKSDTRYFYQSFIFYNLTQNMREFLILFGNMETHLHILILLRKLSLSKIHSREVKMCIPIKSIGTKAPFTYV